MRPLFSVMHSPRLTNRNGVLTRNAPPSTAIGTTHQPIEPSAMISFPATAVVRSLSLWERVGVRG